MDPLTHPDDAPACVEPEGLTRRTVHGVFWSGASQFITQGIGFAVNIVVARLLFPEDFGILAMAAMFIELVSLVSDLGLNAAVVQRRDISQAQLSTCFWLNGLVGMGLVGVSLLCAPLVADVFRKDIVTPVVMVSSLGFLLRAAGSIHKALLMRQLRFRALAVPDIAGILVFGGCVIPMAWSGMGLWSVVTANLISAGVSTGLLWLLTPWRPAWRFDWPSSRPLTFFGANVLGEQMLDYVNLNVDYFLIGRLLGAAALGVYTLAFNLMTFPLRKIAQMVTRVTFPAFSRVQNDDAALRDGYLKTVRYIALVTFPILTGLGILAPDFIRLVYTARWAEAILPLQIMCLDGLVRTVSTTTGSILYAKGRPDIGLKWKVATVCVIPPAVFIGTRYGIVGVSVAVALCTLLLAPVIQFITHRLIGLRLGPFGRALAPAVWTSVLMAGWLAALLLARMRYGFDAGYGFLIFAVLSGGAVYAAGFRVLYHGAYKEMRDLFEHLRG